MKVTDETSPGLFVIVRCLDNICPFLGVSSKDFLNDHLYSCKKLYSRIIPEKLFNIQKKLGDYEKIINEEKAFFDKPPQVPEEPEEKEEEEDLSKDKKEGRKVKKAPKKKKPKKKKPKKKDIFLFDKQDDGNSFN